MGRWIMISDNSYKGPFVCDEDDDEYGVEEVASSTNSDETEFVEFVEDSMDIVLQIPSPFSVISQLSYQAPLTPISFRS